VGALSGDFGTIKKAEYHDAWSKEAVNLGEYDYYLRTHDLINTNMSKDSAERAVQVAEEGLAKYPDSSLIKIQLAWAHFTLGWNGFSNNIASEFRLAAEATRSVLVRENLSPQVKRLTHWLFAWVLASEGDFPRALNEADIAVALAPFDGITHANLSQLMITAGQIEKGLRWNDFAGLRDPKGIQFQNYNKGLAFRLLGKYEESIAAFKQASYPDEDIPLNVAIALVRLGRIDEAKLEVKLGLKNNPNFTGAVFESTYFYRDTSIPNAEVADLAKAGLPEK
jgi:adenylate cyclase